MITFGWNGRSQSPECADGLHKKYPWLSTDICNRIVTTYREVWAPQVPELWWNLKKTAHAAVRNAGKEFSAICGVRYFFDTGAKRPVLICRLLNGKESFYPEPEIKPDDFGKPAIFYSAVKDRVYRRNVAWHGVLTENVVSALARELLVAAILRLQTRGYRVVLSVHDELVVEGAVPQWAIDASIPIAVEAFVTTRYRK